MLQRPLKRGAHGWPELAFRTGDSTEKPYVIKRLVGSLQKPTETNSSPAREIRALLRMRHLNIIEVVEHGRDAKGAEYLVMPYYSRGPIGRSTIPSQPLRVRLAFFLRLCEGVHHAHARGVSHGDLCTQNIVLGDAGEPIIIDFGCCQFDSPDQTSTLPTGPSLGAPPENKSWLAAVRVDCGCVFSLLKWLVHDGLPFPNWPRTVITPQIVPEPMRANFDALLAEFQAIERNSSPISLTPVIDRLKMMLDAWPIEASSHLSQK